MPPTDEDLRAIFGPKGLNLPRVVDRSNLTVPCDLAGNLTFKVRMHILSLSAQAFNPPFSSRSVARTSPWTTATSSTGTPPPGCATIRLRSSHSCFTLTLDLLVS